MGNALLPKEIFDVKMNSDLLHQVVVSQMANRRQISAHTKDRSEVRGGGKKPWRQKGTGRARAGSSRSPLWRGGGVTFGPRKDKIFKRDIPNKIRIKAMLMVLSEKARKNLLVILDELKLQKPKTKEMAGILAKLLPQTGSRSAGPAKSCLIILPNYDKTLVLSSRNIPRISTIEARNLNVLDLMSSQSLIMPKDSIKTIKETFLKNVKTTEE